MALNTLMATADHLMIQSVAASTRGKYASYIKVYHHFCSRFSLQSFPVLESTLIPFATHLSACISHKSIKAHLSAIKYAADIQGHGFQFAPMCRLYRLMRGIKRAQGRKFKKPPRKPITPSLLEIIGANLWNSSFLYEDKLMLWAAMLTAFFGFLRVSEYTSKLVRSYDPTSTLCYKDVGTDVGSNMAVVHIKASKTDPFQNGMSIELYANKSLLCPVEALARFIAVHPTRSGPMFTWQDGRFLTRKHVNTTLQRLKPSHLTDMSSHSFRIGAATTAAAAGCPRWLIQTLGRWTSNCFKDYIRVPKETLARVSNSLATTRSDAPTFDPDNIDPAV